MEITIQRENLSQVDCGGAYREVDVKIFVDDSLPLIKQRQALIFELLSLYLDPLECSGDLITEIAHKLAESLEELG